MEGSRERADPLGSRIPSGGTADIDCCRTGACTDICIMHKHEG